MKQNNTAKNLTAQLTLEEKAQMITGSGGMTSRGIERLGIPEKTMADGPCGIRGEKEKNHTTFPSISALAASWDKEIAKKMGEALGEECKAHGIDMLLAPGVNI